MLEPWFESKGLGDADQVLAYFAVSKLGEPPVDGKTDTNPEGQTASYGTWASVVAERLQAGGLTCKGGGVVEHSLGGGGLKGMDFLSLYLQFWDNLKYV
ncbi:uncharacterized protein Pyn_14048 [Prunus yedoensis var. nudiflora]|uniref:Uncharacterized protein n=1 Tax=Prunus yedoensis var. nudiflora TaxID=2094558 RepID=A0A314YYC6_PRUYE|nr:uncharacterized protein Pyn_14048 [Prunus yedoensis var. nudiflora]